MTTVTRFKTKTSEEAQLRVDLAAAFRWTARLNMHEAVANHFSLAVDDEGVRPARLVAGEDAAVAVKGADHASISCAVMRSRRVDTRAIAPAGTASRPVGEKK